MCGSARPAETQAPKMERAQANKGLSQLSKFRGPLRAEKEGVECLFFVDRESKIGKLRVQSDLNSKTTKNKTKIPEGNDEKLLEKDKKFKNSKN